MPRIWRASRRTRSSSRPRTRRSGRTMRSSWAALPIPLLVVIAPVPVPSAGSMAMAGVAVIVVAAKRCRGVISIIPAVPVRCRCQVAIVVTTTAVGAIPVVIRFPVVAVTVLVFSFLVLGAPSLRFPQIRLGVRHRVADQRRRSPAWVRDRLAALGGRRASLAWRRVRVRLGWNIRLSDYRVDVCDHVLLPLCWPWR